MWSLACGIGNRIQGAWGDETVEGFTKSEITDLSIEAEKATDIFDNMIKVSNIKVESKATIKLFDFANTRDMNERHITPPSLQTVPNFRKQET
jgi:hypothetical protein